MERNLELINRVCEELLLEYLWSTEQVNIDGVNETSYMLTIQDEEGRLVAFEVGMSKEEVLSDMVYEFCLTGIIHQKAMARMG